MNSVEYTATEIQSMVRNMDDSKKKHRRLKESDPAEYIKKLTDENLVSKLASARFVIRFSVFEVATVDTIGCTCSSKNISSLV